VNWLAHVFLSEPDFEFRLGNLLADFVRGPHRERMSAGFQRGARRHVVIDAFTDKHPVPRRSRARIRPECRRFSGILVDIFYDHFLARQWERHATEPFASFRAKFYLELSRHTLVLPPDAQTVIDHIVETDRFGAYAQVEGIAATLHRFSRRLSVHWGRTVDLTDAMADLDEHYQAFAGDFEEFFPEIRQHVLASA
jgi:acyl carrier protein phosphodiesterase